jgi:hypothetical protein
MLQEQKWETGDVFLIENDDGMYSVAQVIGREPDVLNSVSCAFFDIRVSNVAEASLIRELPNNRLISVLFVTRDLLDLGGWRVVGRLPVVVPKSYFPYEKSRSTGFVGAKVIGTKNVNEFINAYHGLKPWDDWKDPHYLDKLLLSPDKKPSNVRYKN